MLTLIRKVSFYKRITAMVDRYIDKYPESYKEFDNIYNTLYIAILGLSNKSRNLLFKKILIELLAKDNNLLLDNKSRKFIFNNFTETEQKIIFYHQNRNISFLKYFELNTLDEMIEALISIFLYGAAPIYLKLWREFFSTPGKKEYINAIAKSHGELVYLTTERLFNKNFPSLNDINLSPN